eukprot:CAMPEP_0176117674 /NCGR_PEP_ID=MMETSP0120_2-20121206/59121_1 /TAXON_ID=160619 /ORGANISM="Kryptoperidinium foliaceum, Strain CCMP 1326" /LENGTH=74 /DNA_ID=CAMNT_0017451975 /DNA_START=92 /DNA_END=313 /DNA_ORIENTATION=+
MAGGTITPPPGTAAPDTQQGEVGTRRHHRKRGAFDLLDAAPLRKRPSPGEGEHAMSESNSAMPFLGTPLPPKQR